MHGSGGVWFSSANGPRAVSRLRSRTGRASAEAAAVTGDPVQAGPSGTPAGPSRAVLLFPAGWCCSPFLAREQTPTSKRRTR